MRLTGLLCIENLHIKILLDRHHFYCPHPFFVSKAGEAAKWYISLHLSATWSIAINLVTGCACFDDHSFYFHDSMTLYAVKLDESRLHSHPTLWCSEIYALRKCIRFSSRLLETWINLQILMLVFCFLSIGKRDYKIDPAKAGHSLIFVVHLPYFCKFSSRSRLSKKPWAETAELSPGDLQSWKYATCTHMHTREPYYVTRFLVFNQSWIRFFFTSFVHEKTPQW